MLIRHLHSPSSNLSPGTTYEASTGRCNGCHWSRRPLAPTVFDKVLLAEHQWQLPHRPHWVLHQQFPWDWIGTAHAKAQWQYPWQLTCALEKVTGEITVCSPRYVGINSSHIVFCYEDYHVCDVAGCHVNDIDAVNSVHVVHMTKYIFHLGTHFSLCSPTSMIHHVTEVNLAQPFLFSKLSNVSC